MSPRQKEFDPDEALEKAMQLFWQKGYEATSMQDLVSHMGINRFSIYETFGGKHELFMAACQRYRDIMEQQMIELLIDCESGLEGIREFFQRLVQSTDLPTSHWGCLITNTTAEKAAGDEELQRCTRDFWEHLEEAFFGALVKARQAGEISADHNPKSLAEFLVNAVNGINVLHKAFQDPGKVKRMVNMTLDVLE